MLCSIYFPFVHENKFQLLFFEKIIFATKLFFELLDCVEVKKKKKRSFLLSRGAPGRKLFTILEASIPRFATALS